MVDILPGDPKKKKTGFIIGIIIAVLILVVAVPIVLFSVGLFQATSDQSETGKQFVALLSEEKYDEAYLMTSSDFQAATSMEDMMLFVENTPILANATATTFNYRGIENNLRIISGTVYAGLESLPLTVHFVKEQDEWKILLFSVDPEDIPVVDAE